MFLIFILLVSSANAYLGNTILPNSYEATVGCMQYNADTDYAYDHPYYATALWRHVRTINGTVTMRMGVSGDKSAYIRLAPSNRPMKETKMHEIVIAFFNDNRSYLQRYVRSSPDKVHSHNLSKYNFTQRISMFEPLMVTIEVYNNQRVTVTRDSDKFPFIDATDVGVSTSYIGFANWNTADKAVFYVDCPLKS